MRHAAVYRCSMPVLCCRWDPDNVTLPDFLDWTTPLLNPARASRHDQCLAQRVGVSCCSGAGLERDTRANRACRILRLEKRVNAHGITEVFGWSLAGGCEPLRVLLIVCESSLDATEDAFEGEMVLA